MAYKPRILEEVDGGTAQSSYTTGDILYASASNTLSKLAAGSNGEVLTLASGVPSWDTPASGSAISFSSYLAGSVANATGAGVSYQLGSGTAMTITSNVGSAYTSAGVFTAPSDGLYVFGFTIALGDLSSSNTNMSGSFDVSSGISYRQNNINIQAIRIPSANNANIVFSQAIPLTTSQTVTMQVSVNGGTQVVDIEGDLGGSVRRTCAYGFKVA